MNSPKLFTLTLGSDNSRVFNIDALYPPKNYPYIQEPIAGKDFPFSVKIEDKDHFYEDAAFWVALVAVIISIFNFGWTDKQNKKARRQSIHDEFWLREVIYPNAIKPCLDFYNEVILNLPEDISNPSCSAAIIDAFKTDFEDKFSINSSQLLIAGYNSKVFYDSLSTEFNNFEDIIIDYCYASSSGFTPTPTSPVVSRSVTVNRISASMASFLKCLQITQESIS